MNNLLNFFIKHSSWFVFALLAVMSLIMLFNNNPYQQSVYLSSANTATASVYKVFSSVTSYLNLRDINEDLQERNALLEMELVKLRGQINDLQMLVEDSTALSFGENNFDYVLAHVISNSVTQPGNFITINRGSNDGIEPEMGVVDQNGVVGIVNVTAPHSARIISLLNPNLKLQCKIKNSEYFGSLVWDGKSPQYAILQDMPEHSRFSRGDTVVTSGYSAVFPEGIIVGVVSEKPRENFTSVKVKLTTDFTRLSIVRAIKNNMHDELMSLQANENKEDKK